MKILDLKFYVETSLEKNLLYSPLFFNLFQQTIGTKVNFKAHAYIYLSNLCVLNQLKSFIQPYIFNAMSQTTAAEPCSHFT